MNLPEIGSRIGESRWTYLGVGTDPGKWLCRCDCGVEKEVNKKNLKSGLSRSCGCLMVESKTRHGHAKRKMGHSLTYSSWGSMVQRCSNKEDVGWENYGGRGIKVCDRWLGESGFQNFLEDMGERPSKEHSIDRYPDNDGNYEPGNCRWATRKEQQRNKRTTELIEFEGKKQCATEWAEEWGMKLSTFWGRRDRGYSMQQIKSTAVKLPRGKQAPSSKNRIVEYEGVSKTIEEWADEFGIKVSMLLGRLSQGWSMARIEATPAGLPRGVHGGKNAGTVEYDGRSQTLQEWAEEFGMSYETFCSRRSLGWSMDRIKNQPVGAPRGKHAKIEDE